jgi:integrase/recombinase XerD
MRARPWAPTPSGPLAWYAAAFESWLAARGYSPFTIGHRLWQLELVSRWLEREGLSVEELTPERFVEFARARRAGGYRSWTSPASMRAPLAFLWEFGVVATRAAGASDGPVEEVLVGYRRWMLHERGVRQRTVVRYEPDARLFLSARLGPDGLDLDRLTAADVSAFLARECPRRSIASARYLAKVLRSLLRYLHVAGLISAPLRWAVPGVADLRDRSLARGLEPAALAKLLGSCDRRRTVGRRDYAIMLLCSRLGLRAGEVAALTLDDLDWRRGELLVRGKGDRHERLPLAADVGEALVSYLRRRPRSECRAVFVKVIAPAGPLSGKAIWGVVHAACLRAGIAPVGPHALRHTAATGMLREGASLEQVAEVLRHRDVRSTAIYAKVDRKALRPLARSWAEGGAA